MTFVWIACGDGDQRGTLPGDFRSDPASGTADFRQKQATARDFHPPTNGATNGDSIRFF